MQRINSQKLDFPIFLKKYQPKKPFCMQPSELKSNYWLAWESHNIARNKEKIHVTSGGSENRKGILNPFNILTSDARKLNYSDEDNSLR